MHISSNAIVPFFLASFVLLGYQYYFISPQRRLLNLRFVMMFGAIALLFCSLRLMTPLLSQVFFALGLIWLGVAIYLLRTMPPQKH
ncbi:MAG: hypothetical protein WDN25_31060 [Acetobacteraceae bacterium]